MGVVRCGGWVDGGEATRGKTVRSTWRGRLPGGSPNQKRPPRSLGEASSTAHKVGRGRVRVCVERAQPGRGVQGFEGRGGKGKMLHDGSGTKPSGIRTHACVSLACARRSTTHTPFLFLLLSPLCHRPTHACGSPATFCLSVCLFVCLAGGSCFCFALLMLVSHAFCSILSYVPFPPLLYPLPTSSPSPSPPSPSPSFVCSSFRSCCLCLVRRTKRLRNFCLFFTGVYHHDDSVRSKEESHCCQQDAHPSTSTPRVSRNVS